MSTKEVTAYVSCAVWENELAHGDLDVKLYSRPDEVPHRATHGIVRLRITEAEVVQLGDDQI